jgi:hypothetical protein
VRFAAVIKPVTQGTISTADSHAKLDDGMGLADPYFSERALILGFSYGFSDVGSLFLDSRLHRRASQGHSVPTGAA